MNSVQCTGREKSITECSFRPVPLYTCKHNHDVAVRCNVPHSGLQATVRGAWLNLLAGAGTQKVPMFFLLRSKFSDRRKPAFSVLCLQPPA